MLELGNVWWTVLSQRATPLLLQRLVRGTSVPREIWPKLSSYSGYLRHGTALYVPAWDIPNTPSHITLFQSLWEDPWWVPLVEELWTDQFFMGRVMMFFCVISQVLLTWMPQNIYNTMLYLITHIKNHIFMDRYRCFLTVPFPMLATGALSKWMGVGV